MHEALARQRRAGRRASTRSFAANRDFHLALVAASGNQFLEQLARVLWVARIGEAIYEAQAETPERMRLDADEHEAILAAVERGRRARGGDADPPPRGGGDQALAAVAVRSTLQRDRVARACRRPETETSTTSPSRR